MTAIDPIAVTVIGGYLGSGKTTLVNNLLTTSTERIAVLVNDFGDINIDLELIESSSDNTIELTNGCICCSMVDGFAAALDQVRALRPRPGRLVIEASGVSDPAPVAAFGHGKDLLLDGTIVLVDAETIEAQSEDRYIGQLIASQLDAAQILIVNKIDLVTASQAETTMQWLANRCPDAFLSTAVHAAVPSEVLLGASFGEADVTTLDQSETSGHDQLFRTSTINRDAPMDRSDLDDLLDGLGADVVRAKGLVWLNDDSDKPAVVQRVGQRLTVRRLPGWKGDPATRLVVIRLTPRPRT